MSDAPLLHRCPPEISSRLYSEVTHSQVEHIKNHPHKSRPEHPSHYSDAEHASKLNHEHELLTDGLLHSIKLTDIEHEKQMVVDARVSESKRLMAAHELLANNIKEFSGADDHGRYRHIRLEISSIDGRLRIREASHIILEDVLGLSYTNHLRPPAHAQGMHFASHHFEGVGTYNPPSAQTHVHVPEVDPRFYKIMQSPDGSKSVEFNGCAVDTDGASRHREDKCWQSHTSLRLSNGESLNTDLDNFVVLSPSLAKACGVKLGDCGYLVDKSTGRAVPVMFGDCGPEGKKSAEASVHAIKQLGRHEKIDGNRGLEGRFEVVVVPKTGTGTGDLARNPDAIKRIIDSRIHNL